MDLNLKEKEIIEFLRHKRSTSIQPLPEDAICSSDHLSTANKNNYKSVFNSLIIKGLLKYIVVFPNREYYLLTRKGETYIYGKFEINTGVQEFMNIFRHYNLLAGVEIKHSKIINVKTMYFSPINEERLNEIVECAIEKGLIVRKDIMTYALTEYGERFVYKYV